MMRFEKFGVRLLTLFSFLRMEKPAVSKRSSREYTSIRVAGRRSLLLRAAGISQKAYISRFAAFILYPY